MYEVFNPQTGLVELVAGKGQCKVYADWANKKMAEGLIVRKRVA